MMYAETFKWVLEDHILPLDVALCSAACVGKEAWRVGVLVCYSLLSRGSLARSFSDAASAGGGALAARLGASRCARPPPPAAARAQQTRRPAAACSFSPS